MYALQRFNTLSAAMQIQPLNHHGVSLDLRRVVRSTDVALFAYHDFYVELTVLCVTNEILSIKAFQNLKRLEAYLPQVDISKITVLLTCN